MKLFHVNIKIFVLLSLFLFSICRKDSDKKNFKGFSKSFFSSSFSSFSSSGGKGAKPETHMRSMSTEEYIDQKDGKIPQIRKYGEMFAKDNDRPGVLKKDAKTNVERESLILGGDKSAEVKLLNKNEEKNFFGANKLNLFGMRNPFPSMFDSFPLMFDFPKDNTHALGIKDKHQEYGRYDKFLMGKAKNFKK